MFNLIIFKILLAQPFYELRRACEPCINTSDRIRMDHIIHIILGLMQKQSMNLGNRNNVILPTCLKIPKESVSKKLSKMMGKRYKEKNE